MDAASHSAQVTAQPRVALVVPVHNRRAKTLRFLEIMQSQTYKALQVIVVDAASTDGTSESIRQRFPQVIVLSVSDRCYWAGTTNAGVAYALDSGFDYIFTVNDDSVVAPGHIERMVQLADQYGCQILGNRINYLSDPGLTWSIGTFSDWGSQNFLRLAHHNVREADLPAVWRQQDVLETESLPGNGVLIHRSVFKKIGLYNEIFLPHYHADSELIMRAREAGIQPFVSPNTILYNDFSIQQKQLDLKSLTGIYYGFLNKRSHLFLLPILYIFLKYCPLKQKWHTLTALLSRLMNLSRS